MTYISLTVILAPVELVGTGALELNVPLKKQLVGIAPPIVTPVSSPVAVLRSYVPVAGLSTVDLPRHARKLSYLTRKADPMTLVTSLVMFGSVPEKLRYRTCQGRVSVRIVAVPGLTHGPSLASLMKPIRVPGTFEMVLECRDPESVTWQSTMPSGIWNLTEVKLALRV